MFNEKTREWSEEIQNLITLITFSGEEARVGEQAHEAAQVRGFGGVEVESGGEVGDGDGSAVVVDDVWYAKLDSALKRHGTYIVHCVILETGQALQKL